MAGDIWLIIASRLKRLRGSKAHQGKQHAIESEPRSCDRCGKQEPAVKLAGCSTCRAVYCGGECFSLHQPRGRHAA